MTKDENVLGDYLICTYMYLMSHLKNKGDIWYVWLLEGQNWYINVAHDIREVIEATYQNALLKLIYWYS